MNPKVLASFLGLALALALMTPAIAAEPDYGTPLSAAEYESAVKDFFENHLKDPGSAQYKFGDAFKDTLKVSGLMAGKHRGSHYGYMVPVRVNAKNSYGGYIGYKLYWFFFLKGKDLAAYKAFNGDGEWWWVR